MANARLGSDTTLDGGATPIAAYLARGESVPDAVSRSKEYITRALESGFSLGSGAGPLNHFWPVRDV